MTAQALMSNPGAVYGLLGTIFAALVAAAGAIYAARKSREAAERTVDVQLVEIMQREVQSLSDRVTKLRADLVHQQDENDRLRTENRRQQAQIYSLEEKVTKLTSVLDTAGINLE